MTIDDHVFISSPHSGRGSVCRNLTQSVDVELPRDRARLRVACMQTVSGDPPIRSTPYALKVELYRLARPVSVDELGAAWGQRDLLKALCVFVTGAQNVLK